MIPSGWHNWLYILTFFGITSIPTYQLLTSHHSPKKPQTTNLIPNQEPPLVIYWKARFSHPIDQFSINGTSITLEDNQPEGDLSLTANQKELSICITPKIIDTPVAFQLWVSLPEQETKTNTYWIQQESTLTFYIH